MQNRNNEEGLLFSNINGEAILDPRHEANPKKRIHDYQASHAETNTYIAEFKGSRYRQEDQFTVESIPEFNFLSDNQKIPVLKDAINVIEEEMQNSELGTMKGGSTLCTVVMSGKSLYTANVGDSTAILVVRNHLKEITEFKLLNQVLHYIGYYNVEFLRSKGVAVSRTQLRMIDENGDPSINIYRAMGDFELISSGLSSKPDMYVDNVIIPENGDAFVINACDGLTESLTLIQLKLFLKQNKQTALEELPLLLTNYAYHCGSNDNVTVIITPIEENKAKLIAVFDGHSGDHVSLYLNKHFSRRLQNEILLKNCFNGEENIETSEVNKKLLAQQREQTIALQSQLQRYQLHDFFFTINKSYFEVFKSCKTNEEKFSLATLHYKNLFTVLAKVMEALTLRAAYSLGLSPSDQSRFKKSNVDPDIKSVITNLESKAKNLIKSYDATLSIPYSEVKYNEMLVILAESTRVILNSNLIAVTSLVTQLLGKKLYSDVLQQANNLHDKIKLCCLEKKPLSPPDVNLTSNEMDIILFSTYVDTYRFSREKLLFDHSRPGDKVARWIEEILKVRFPEIVSIYNIRPHGDFDFSLTNRILWHIGENSPALVDKIHLELQLLQATKNPSNEKLFIATGKLLGRLGKSGFEKCSVFFNPDHENNASIHESEIKTYFQKNSM